MAATTYFACSDGVTEKTIGNELALYVERRRSIHVLNSTSRVVWESLKEPLTFDELMGVLGRVFDVDREKLRCDLEETLALFRQLDLLQTIDG
jgi:hypothetical protein